MYRRIILGLGVGLFVALLAVCIWPTLTAAQIKPKGLTLSPLRSELDIAPGTSIDKALTVTNSTDQPMTVNLSAEQFNVINPQYDYAFTAESDLTNWVAFNPAQVDLAAGQTKKVPYAIGVPLTAEPGGRYVSLFASTDSEASDGGIISRQRVASLLYITVQGEVSRVGQLVSLSSPWAVGGRGQWSMALQNSGSTHFRSRYDVSVQNIFNNKVVATMAGDALILPGTVRAVADTLPLPKLPGIYKYVYTIGLGDTPAKVESRYVVYMPPVVVDALILMAILLAIGLWRRRAIKS